MQPEFPRYCDNKMTNLNGVQIEGKLVYEQKKHPLDSDDIDLHCRRFHIYKVEMSVYISPTLPEVTLCCGPCQVNSLQLVRFNFSDCIEGIGK